MRYLPRGRVGHLLPSLLYPEGERSRLAVALLCFPKKKSLFFHFSDHLAGDCLFGAFLFFQTAGHILTVCGIRTHDKNNIRFTQPLSSQASGIRFGTSSRTAVNSHINSRNTHTKSCLHYHYTIIYTLYHGKKAAKTSFHSLF